VEQLSTGGTLVSYRKTQTRLLHGVLLAWIWALGCDQVNNTNIPDGEGGGTEGGGEWKTFFVGDAHVYDGSCNLPNFTYCVDAYACDVAGADIAAKLQSLGWSGVFSDNDLHEHIMWKDAGAGGFDGADFVFADKYNVAWYLGHSNIGYLSFTDPHPGDPWSSPCVLGSVQTGVGLTTISGPNIGKGGNASMFVHLGSCAGYYGPDYDTQCMEKNWGGANVRQILTFAGSPVVSKLQVTDFIEELEKGKNNTDAWLAVMHTNHGQPFTENNPVVYTYAAGHELQQTPIGTIADDANMLTGAWVTPPLPAAMDTIAISAYSGSENMGNTSNCLPQSAPLPCE